MSDVHMLHPDPSCHVIRRRFYKTLILCLHLAPYGLAWRFLQHNLFFHICEAAVS